METNINKAHSGRVYVTSGDGIFFSECSLIRITWKFMRDHESLISFDDCQIARNQCDRNAVSCFTV